ncbi:MAG: 6-bladed beta-propeller [Lentisphaerae bacterium]|nr:6-bladed beta-propeller [Lentisphaerota bacterium]
MPRPCVFLLILLAAGCATPPLTQPPRADLVWPPAPEPPRVAYVQSLSRPADIGIQRSRFTRAIRWLTGADEDDLLVKPFGVALDEDDNLCITDTGSRSVFLVDRTKSTWRRWDHAGKLHFVSPVAVARRDGIFYVADAGLGSVVVFGENGKLRRHMTNELTRPVAIAFAGDRLLVADAQRHRIAMFDPEGRFITSFGKRGEGPGEFNFPTHITVDLNGRILVTDSLNGRVQIFDRDGTFLSTFGQPGDSIGSFSRPKGVATDTQDHVYVVDANFDNIQTFDMAGRTLLVIGAAGSEPGCFWLPNGIVISRHNEIFVADTYNRRIQILRYVGPP